MAGMRDRLIHGYFGVDDEIIWKTAREFAPEIRLEITIWGTLGITSKETAADICIMPGASHCQIS
jgi:hypothetical protein